MAKFKVGDRVSTWDVQRSTKGNEVNKSGTVSNVGSDYYAVRWDGGSVTTDSIEYGDREYTKMSTSTPAAMLAQAIHTATKMGSARRGFPDAEMSSDGKTWYLDCPVCHERIKGTDKESAYQKGHDHIDEHGKPGAWYHD